ncbi:MAG: flavodoxin-dependent (E)-4-hydroxy-3-methylbut-2-enyl-diphosphate synthase [Oscillospiraceae bacterium]|nr:flavodoxin-dependent (E)-4-hydroxy-3-methylbut-2-enyl-diphosphate synthase [Oscillospiraceae bacterium]
MNFGFILKIVTVNFTFSRRNSKKVKIGNLCIGAFEPVAVQSMLNAPSGDINANILQARELEDAGCDIIRVAIPEIKALHLIDALKTKINMPIVADVHYSADLAVECARAGADKIRINPGNIGKESEIEKIVSFCSELKIPIRIGINSGSLPNSILERFGGVSSLAISEYALETIKIFEKMDFKNIVISVKSSCLKTCVESYKIISKKCNYPLHVGVTETGVGKTAIIKSAIGIGSLLMEGIGDTIRVSLSASPIKEVEAGLNILKCLGLRGGVSIISCPTCGRTTIDVIDLANKAETLLKNIEKNIKVAIMGCSVNGPGEAREADIGITGAGGIGVIFKKGVPIKKVRQEALLDELLKEVSKIE